MSRLARRPPHGGWTRRTLALALGTFGVVRLVVLALDCVAAFLTAPQRQ